VNYVDKADFLMWSRKYDKAYGWQAGCERDLGAKIRKNKQLTLADLMVVAEWKFHGEPEKVARAQELVTRNDPAKVERVTSQALSLPQNDDMFRMNCLTTLDGVSPVLASVILTFFKPEDYGIFDAAPWKMLLGNVPSGMQTPQNYIRLLTALRKTAKKHNLAVRIIDKALYKKSHDTA
jgi:hypothetical protein